MNIIFFFEPFPSMRREVAFSVVVFINIFTHTYGSLEGPFKIPTFRVPRTQYLDNWWQKDVFPTLNSNILFGNGDLLSCMHLGISTFCFNMTTCWVVVNSTSQHLVGKWGHVKLETTRYLNILLQNDDILSCRHLGMSSFWSKMMTYWVAGTSVCQYFVSKWRRDLWSWVADNSVRSTFCSKKKKMAWWVAGN